VAFKSPLGSQDLARYVNQVLVQETDVQARLRAETAPLPFGGMQVAADQGAFLAFLVRLIGARRVLEVGTFTGYSALCMAAALNLGMLMNSNISTNARGQFWSAGTPCK
jgi:predicted O-methyltransferase YrrM